MKIQKGQMGEVLLRDMLEEDLPILFEHQDDPEACEMAAFAARERDTFMEHWTEILVDETVDKKTILFDGRAAGYIVSFERDGKRQVGYWIGKTFWGQGIASRALAVFLDHVDSRPLYAFVAKHNLGSLRVLEKCGFTIDGEGIVPCEAGEPEIEEFILLLGPDGGS
jgi:RimJ/RimL family protein N-acetyltransferase